LIFVPLICAVALHAQEIPRTISLPPPNRTGGKPLMQVFSERQSRREFSEVKLSEQQLSNLLWAAFGVNRPDGRRTAPSARNWQEISLYLCMEDGVFLFDAQNHTLQKLMGEDIRKLTGTQPYVEKAPLDIVYVADMTKVGARSGDDVSLYLGADCGLIAENVYLYCASEGLATVVRGMVNREELAAALHLQTTQRIILSQTVGLQKAQ